MSEAKEVKLAFIALRLLYLVPSGIFGYLAFKTAEAIMAGSETGMRTVVSLSAAGIATLVPVFVASWANSVGKNKV